MEDDLKKTQNLRNLDIQHLKNEKESLIKSNYLYSERIGMMEIEISDLKAMLQAVQNENQTLTLKFSKMQDSLQSENQIHSLKRQIEQITQEKLKSETSLKQSIQGSEFEDLTEELSELKDELLYLKGEYIPKLEHQVKNAKLLIAELESEITELSAQNENYQTLIEQNIPTHFATPPFTPTEQKREFLQPSSPTEYLKEENVFRSLKPKPRLAAYVPSIRRMEKKTPEFTIQLSKGSR